MSIGWTIVLCWVSLNAGFLYGVWWHAVGADASTEGPVPQRSR